MDAGGPATVFAMTSAGAALAEYRLMGVSQTDWEDLAVGPGPATGSYIYVGDFGDNNANRTEIQIYRFAEPTVSTTQAMMTTSITNSQVLRFTYPDGAHNAESLMIDPPTGDIVIITKEAANVAAVFRAPGNTAPAGVHGPDPERGNRVFGRRARVVHDRGEFERDLPSDRQLPLASRTSAHVCGPSPRPDPRSGRM